MTLRTAGAWEAIDFMERQDFAPPPPHPRPVSGDSTII